MYRWFWICPILVVLLSVTVIFYWGWSWVSLLVIALALVCPAIIVWGAIHIRKTRVDELDGNVKKIRKDKS